MNDLRPTYPNELYHHGIKGMKWGVRRYQNPDGSYTAAGRKRYGIGDKASTAKGLSMTNRIIGSKGEIGMDALTAELIYYGTVTLAAYGIGQAVKHSQIKKHNEELQTRRSDSEFKSLSDIPKMETKMPANESMKIVNPTYPKPGSTLNCTLCTTAMVMREKGYDVEASTSEHGFYNKSIDKLFGSGGEFKKAKCRNMDKLGSKLANEGDGAYGNLLIYWKAGGGHSIFWKNENGVTHYYDGQCGQEYNPSQLQRAINVRESEYARLDNVEPTDLILGVLKRRQ